jgi:hypothetical protein
MPVLFRCLSKLAGAARHSSSSHPVLACRCLQAPLALARTLMAGSLDIRDSFDDLGGPALVVDLHKQHIGDVDLQVGYSQALASQSTLVRCWSSMLTPVAETWSTLHVGMQAELASVAECGCFREEQNKECFMEAGYGVSLLQLLQRHSSGPASSSEAGLPEPLVVAACGVLRALTTADDDRPPSSKAFINARLLARQHQVRQEGPATCSLPPLQNWSAAGVPIPLAR